VRRALAAARVATRFTRLLTAVIRSTALGVPCPTPVGVGPRATTVPACTWCMPFAATTAARMTCSPLSIPKARFTPTFLLMTPRASNGVATRAAASALRTQRVCHLVALVAEIKDVTVAVGCDPGAIVDKLRAAYTRCTPVRWPLAGRQQPEAGRVHQRR